MLIHDAVILANKSKYYSIGIQLFDKCFECNHTIVLSFGKVSTTGGKHIFDLTREVVEETTSFNFHTLTGSSIQDCATISVTEEPNLESEKCTMHQGDKIGKSSIKELAKSRNEVIDNPFPVGLNLSKKLHDQAQQISAVLTNKVNYNNFFKIT